MYLLNIIAFIAILKNAFTNGSLLLYSTTNIKIPALQKIEKDDLEKIFQKANHPKIITFAYDKLNANVVELFNNKYSCFLPNSDVTFENATGNKDQDRHLIKRVLRPFKDEDSIVIALTSMKKRLRRDTDSQSNTESPGASSKVDANPTGPVLFNASVTGFQTMIFSAQPPKLYINNTAFILGNPPPGRIDERGTYTRLVVTINSTDKVTLRFRFPWLDGYWSLKRVEVEVGGSNILKYNLSLKNEIQAPRRFSYHCGGETVFKDPKDEDVNLTLYNIQVQADARSNAFSDAYNCVPFTTVPIWSGLFVTFILIVGLIIGLGALGDIKTMDKFDNYKTKQLGIAIAD